MSDSARARAIQAEQEFVDEAYGRLDELNENYRARLAAVRAQTGQESKGEMTERDSFATHYEDNLLRLRNVENRLVLGRLDLTDGRVEHIGRIGLKNDAQEIILLDWRARQAEPFYRATPAEPAGVIRRRHILTRLRKVTGVEDELLDTGAQISDLNLTGEGALMATMNAARGGKMTDIVATIQAEQDRIIRASERGVLVVQGGPGTGKTAVALHRAAYLLYAQRERLRRSGVLVIGPSPIFLRYIDEVLPALGESDVVATTIGGLLPGITPTREDSPKVAEIKGRLIWRKIAERAVTKILQPRLFKAVELQIDGERVLLTPGDVDSAQRRARGREKQHNEAREIYARHLVDLLASRVAAAKDLTLEENPWITADVASSPEARREINLRWLPSSPEHLLGRLWSHPELLARVAPELSTSERTLLVRERGAGFSTADIPLLDELAEHLGSLPDQRSQSQKTAASQAMTDMAASTISSLGLTSRLVDPQALVERMGGGVSTSHLAERAGGDRTWTYGHVVVDEAQELTPMQWEMLIRRCPTRSFTIVGDVDQRPAGAPTGGWGQLLGRLREHMRVEKLTISYRTPGMILNAAQRALEAVGVNVAPVRAARELEGALTHEDVGYALSSIFASSGDERASRDSKGDIADNTMPNPGQYYAASQYCANPSQYYANASKEANRAQSCTQAHISEAHISAGQVPRIAREAWKHALKATLSRHCRAMEEEYGEGNGTLAFVVAQAQRGLVASLLAEISLDMPWKMDLSGSASTARIRLLTPYESKGLEYDVVVLIEPSQVLREGPGSLYVAMTRPTKHLHILAGEALPAGIEVNIAG